MNNIFENARFGDKFRTRYGVQVVFLYKYEVTDLEDNKHILVRMSTMNGVEFSVALDGSCNPDGETSFDIVSKLQERAY